MDKYHEIEYKNGVSKRLSMVNKIHQDIDNIHLYFDEEDPEKNLSDFLVCECNGVSLSEIREEFTSENFDLELAKEKFKLGSGCSSCLKSKLDWIKKI